MILKERKEVNTLSILEVRNYRKKQIEKLTVNERVLLQGL